MEPIYTGAAEFGKFASWFIAVLGTIIAVMFIYEGIRVILNPAYNPSVTRDRANMYIFGGIGSIVVLWFIVYLANRFKFFAAAAGVADVVSLF